MNSPIVRASLKEWRFDTIIMSISFSPDGRYFAAGGEDGIVLLCSVSDTTVYRTLAPATDTTGYRISSVSFSGDGKSILIGGGVLDFFGDLRLWHLGDGTVDVADKRYRDLCRASFFRDFDGRESIVSCGGGFVTVWHSLLDEPVAEFLHGSYASAAIASQDGATIYSGGFDSGKGKDKGQVRVWDVKEKKCRMTLRSKNQGVFTLALSPDQSVLAGACSVRDQGYIEFWDTQTGELLNRACHNPFMTFSMAFSHSGTHLFYGDYDGVHLYKRLNDTLETLFVPSDSGLSVPVAAIQLDISQEGALFASMTDKTVRLWEI